MREVEEQESVTRNAKEVDQSTSSVGILGCRYPVDIPSAGEPPIPLRSGTASVNTGDNRDAYKPSGGRWRKSWSTVVNANEGESDVTNCK